MRSDAGKDHTSYPVELCKKRGEGFAKCVGAPGPYVGWHGSGKWGAGWKVSSYVPEFLQIVRLRPFGHFGAKRRVAARTGETAVVVSQLLLCRQCE